MIENDTTRKMESHGRSRGLKLKVRKVLPNSILTFGQKPGFYVISQAGLDLTYPMLLGASVMLAYEAIDEMEV